jgi:cell wall-associated NlpC family hydrolase
MSYYQDDGTCARTALGVAASKAGSPYVWGAAGPNSFDCSGYVHYCYATAGLPSAGNPTSHLWVTATLQFMGDPVAYGQEQPGDLVMPDAGHVGLCAGNGQYWDAPHTGTVVQLQSYAKPFAIRRVATPSTGATSDALLANASTSSNPFSELWNNFQWISQAHNWFRIAQVIFGAALILFALKTIQGRL